MGVKGVQLDEIGTSDGTRRVPVEMISVFVAPADEPGYSLWGVACMTIDMTIGPTRAGACASIPAPPNGGGNWIPNEVVNHENRVRINNNHRQGT